MRSKIIVTDDKSKTLLIPELNETYHSTKGALTECKHVFIKEGIIHSQLKEFNILEMGFGTGLNAIMTLQHVLDNDLSVNYHTLESHPLDLELVSELDYLHDAETQELKPFFELMHQTEWNKVTEIHPQFQFTKFHTTAEEHIFPEDYYDLVFYDAFGPKVQPELWKEDLLSHFHKALRQGGILVTYCAQGAFKRALKALGFEVQSIPGPPGKREMTRAVKV